MAIIINLENIVNIGYGIVNKKNELNIAQNITMLFC